MCTLRLCLHKFNQRVFNAILFLLVFSLIAFLYCFLDSLFISLTTIVTIWMRSVGVLLKLFLLKKEW